MVLSNDERGWVMTSLSGIACVLGASVICVDIIIRQFPGQRDFKIQDSDTFLSTSLSLSFGVMLFSSLYSMLPSSKSSLIKSGYDPKTATWIMIACFLGGFVGIQILSGFIHQYMPSHVVDCEHSHDDGENARKEVHHECEDETVQSSPRTPTRTPRRPRTRTKSSLPGHLPQAPLLPSPRSRQSSYFSGRNSGTFAPTLETEARFDADGSHANGKAQDPSVQRPTFQQRLTSRLSRLTSSTQKQCDPNCRGFTDVCGSECFKNVSIRGGSRAPTRTSLPSLRNTLKQNKTTSILENETTPLMRDIDGNSSHNPAANMVQIDAQNDHHHAHHYSASREDSHEQQHNHDTHEGEHHHHHVPANAFLSIGLQTSIAIALHKLPEGFITYATNHANPQLGFSVFLALFIHNITEGFAMALPLYLAINSRIKAMMWSFVLGGLSQPLGAGVAALWFKIAGNGDWAPSEGVYGGMFAATAGIMVSVALQLFSESLDLTHSRTLCMAGAITGMCILGISNALTAS